MNEVKFRVWDIQKKKMCKVYNLRLDIDEVWWVNMEGDYEVSGMVGNNNLILMQYVGLKDKGEREFYQSDLVQKDGDDRLYEVLSNSLGVRPFHKDSLQSVGMDVLPAIDFFPIKMPGDICKDWTLISNIYEKI